MMSGFRSIFLSCLFTTLVGVILFELGMYKSNEYYIEQIDTLMVDQAKELIQTWQTIKEKDILISKKDIVIADKDNQIEELKGNKDDLANQITELDAQIAGLSTYKNPYPFAVPTTGIVGSKISRFRDNNNGIVHFGIDIWTTTLNNGAISTHKGNPVYAACSGVVESFQPNNGGVTISCDRIPSTFDVPVKKVYTYYRHLGNAETKEKYIVIKYGQRVEKGQFIGFQGDLSEFTPGMRNIHLHFSIFTGRRESEGTQDPCKYIGGECNEIGAFFVSEMSF